MIDDIDTISCLSSRYLYAILSQSHRSLVYLGCESAVDIHVDYKWLEGKLTVSNNDFVQTIFRILGENLRTSFIQSRSIRFFFSD